MCTIVGLLFICRERERAEDFSTDDYIDILDIMDVSWVVQKKKKNIYIYSSSFETARLPSNVLCFVMPARMSTMRSAAAMDVVSATESYGGLTSTTSAPTRLMPSRPLSRRFSSRVVHPPDSGVPVAGAMLGSRTADDPC